LLYGGGGEVGDNFKLDCGTGASSAPEPSLIYFNLRFWDTLMEKFANGTRSKFYAGYISQITSKISCPFR